MGGAADLIDRLIAHALAERIVGVLMVRRGGFAAGVFEGDRLTASKVGARHVKALQGGGLVSAALRPAPGRAGSRGVRRCGGYAARILAPRAADFDALVVGGDAGAISALRTDLRLKSLWSKESAPFLNVGDPG